MVYYPSGFWKVLCRKALQNHWLTGLLIALVVNLPSLLVQAIASVTGNDLMARLQEVILSSVSPSGTTVDAERLTAGMRALRESTGVWVMQGMNVVAWLLTPCLTLGMVAWLLGRLRKEEDPGVIAVFSRMRLFFKGILLRLYTAWRMLLFMLPGLALSVAAMLPIWLSDGESRISVLSAVNTAMGLETAALIVTAVLGAIAALKYALGDMYLADHPEWGPVKAAKESKRSTQGRKGQLFGLYFSFVFWYLLEMMAVTLCLDMFGSIPALMVQMLAGLALTLYVNGAVCAFYLGAPELKEAAEKAELQDLN